MPTINEASIKKLFEEIDDLIVAIHPLDEPKRNQLDDIQALLTTVKNAIPSDAGGAATAQWATLTDAVKTRLYDRLAQVRDAFQRLASPGPIPPTSLMSFTYASNAWIYVLLGTACSLTLILLIWIGCRWSEATGTSSPAAFRPDVASLKTKYEAAAAADHKAKDARRHVDERRRKLLSEASNAKDAKAAADKKPEALANLQKAAQDTTKTADEKQKAYDAAREAVQNNDPEGPEAAAALKKAESEAKAARDAAAKAQADLKAAQDKPQPSAKTDDDAKNVEEEVKKASELETLAEAAAKELAAAALQGSYPSRAILLVIVLFGALGGCVRLLASLAQFIGNRKLYRSWIPYYLALPFVGAALAFIVFVLFNAGLLPKEATADTTVNRDSLNYAFGIAGLIGLFSRDALAMLSELVKRIFSVKETDSDNIG